VKRGKYRSVVNMQPYIKVTYDFDRGYNMLLLLVLNVL